MIIKILTIIITYDGNNDNGVIMDWDHYKHRFFFLDRHNKKERSYEEPRLSFANTPLKDHCEPEWTPNTSDYQDCDTSQEINELNEEEIVFTYNDAMSKLSSAFEPLESRSKVAWQSTTEAKRKEIRGKALQGCRVVCEVIAPKAASELFESICKKL